MRNALPLETIDIEHYRMNRLFPPATTPFLSAEKRSSPAPLPVQYPNECEQTRGKLSRKFAPCLRRGYSRIANKCNSDDHNVTSGTSEQLSGPPHKRKAANAPSRSPCLRESIGVL